MELQFSKITKWELLTNAITESWIKNYFEVNNSKHIDFFWVSDEIGSVFYFADYWFDFKDVLFCLKNNIPKEKLFDWYDYNLKNKADVITLINYINPPKKIKHPQYYNQNLNIYSIIENITH